MSEPATRGAAPRHPALESGWPWVVAWLLTRGWMLHQWAAHYDFIANDVRYYFGQLSQPGGYQVVLREYPLPVVWLLDLLRLPVAGRIELYVTLFALTMAALDAAFSVWLWHTHSRPAALYWMAFGLAMGPLLWFRFDLLPAVVVGAAAFLVGRNPRASGALLAVGAAVKLWPALLLAAMVGRGRRSRQRVEAFATTGLGLALGSLVVAGPTRLFSPLTWQSGRGLQIESVWASAPMWLRAFGTPAQQLAWQVQMSPYNAFEVYGQGAAGWQRASDVAMVLAVSLCAVVGVLAWRRGRLSPDVRALACVAVVAVMLVANKTLSPQYVAWLGAACAAWLGLSPAGPMRLRAASTGVAALVLALLTQYVYPNHYGELISGVPAGAGPTAALVARNVLLVAITLLCAIWTLRALLSTPDEPNPPKVDR